MLEGNVIEKIGILGNSRKDATVSFAKRLARLLKDVDILWEDELARVVGFGDGVPVSELGTTQLVITLGGDGTMLRAARELAATNTPILGVNLGHLGFLTDILPDELEQSIPTILSGDFQIDERMMFEAAVLGTESENIIGLNEATIDKGGSPRMPEITIYVSGHLVSHIGADGVIVATPTGSTAYSMAAGGAIVAPWMDAFILTSLAPYTLAIRPLIVSSDDSIEIKYKSNDIEELPHLAIDGQITLQLPPNGAVSVRKSKHRARFVTCHKRSFYDILRTKLGWGPPPSSR